MNSCLKKERARIFCASTREVILLIFCALFFCSAQAVFADEEESYQLRGRDKVFAVHFLDEETGWAVGARGLALKTSNGGKTWRQYEQLPDRTFNDIMFVGDTGWIVGDNGLVLKTTDAGSTWKRQESNCSRSLLQVFFVDEQRGFSVGKETTLLQSRDGGSSWEQYFINLDELAPECSLEMCILLPNLYDIFFLDSMRGWIVGADGLILATTNGGTTWELVHLGKYPNLYSIAFKNASEGWAVGQNGLLLHTSDSGKTWKNQQGSLEASLYKVHMIGEDGVVVGDLGTVLQTDDGGMSWERVIMDLPPPLPWFLDGWIIPQNASGEVVCVGQGCIVTYPYK